MPRTMARYSDPEGARYGLPTYSWKGAPAGLATRRQLRNLGLCPGRRPVVAQVLWHRGPRRPPGVAYLYSIEHARPKRTATPAVLAALDSAMRTRRTCGTCGTVRPYCIPRSLGECVNCAERSGSLATVAA